MDGVSPSVDNNNTAWRGFNPNCGDRCIETGEEGYAGAGWPKGRRHEAAARICGLQSQQ
ncbi:MAG: hypothetical protein KO206_09620 [Methanomicrobiaceae archaeon]|uniref:Uncharacterized protein n=1 Tax=hydrocarbon metagenome TaxID=938273 RepID=A0A0W8FFZ7_9ZZZZ|nr:hypothetical protein [Methanomicrobiaceae archaeon]MDD5418801.1 hypothetical protein [Methanomicrobiaceae archaeon]